jgi:hypothetical protein
VQPRLCTGFLRPARFIDPAVLKHRQGQQHDSKDSEVQDAQIQILMQQRAHTTSQTDTHIFIDDWPREIAEVANVKSLLSKI